MARILLVDDEKDLVWAVRHSLTDEGYEVYTAHDGIEASSIARRHRPDIFVLDIIMPRLDGLQLCQILRRDPNLASVPILFLTARRQVEDRIAGLDEGGDDYLIKPFDMRELKARLRALLRRGSPVSESAGEPPEAAVVTVGALVLDLHTHELRVGKEIIALTPTEFDLLHFLMTHPGEVFSSKQLLEQVWGYLPDTIDPSLARWHIKNLRAKMEADPSCPAYLRTVSRHGYMLVQPTECSPAQDQTLSEERPS